MVISPVLLLLWNSWRHYSFCLLSHDFLVVLPFAILKVTLFPLAIPQLSVSLVFLCDFIFYAIPLQFLFPLWSLLQINSHVVLFLCNSYGAIPTLHKVDDCLAMLFPSRQDGWLSRYAMSFPPCHAIPSLPCHSLLTLPLFPPCHSPSLALPFSSPLALPLPHAMSFLSQTGWMTAFTMLFPSQAGWMIVFCQPFPLPCYSSCHAIPILGRTDNCFAIPFPPVMLFFYHTILISNRMDDFQSNNCELSSSSNFFFLFFLLLISGVQALPFALLADS